MYTVYLYSNDKTYPHFPGVEHDWISGDTVRYEKGDLILGKYVGARYDTQVKRNDTPIGAFCSDDPYYFYRTKLVLNELGDAR